MLLVSAAAPGVRSAETQCQRLRNADTTGAVSIALILACRVPGMADRGLRRETGPPLNSEISDFPRQVVQTLLWLGVGCSSTGFYVG